jgi:hypothetical protein
VDVLDVTFDRDGAKDQIWDIVFSFYNESSKRIGHGISGISAF